MVSTLTDWLDKEEVKTLSYTPVEVQEGLVNIQASRVESRDNWGHTGQGGGRGAGLFTYRQAIKGGDK